jgi:hypothetical protein
MQPAHQMGYIRWRALLALLVNYTSMRAARMQTQHTHPLHQQAASTLACKAVTPAHIQGNTAVDIQLPHLIGCMRIGLPCSSNGTDRGNCSAGASCGMSYFELGGRHGAVGFQGSEGLGGLQGSTFTGGRFTGGSRFGRWKESSHGARS